ncbi:MAG TPA: group I intron-associated PD-(D/E)XK endonuclease [Ktedonobacteraceae bacterium]
MNIELGSKLVFFYPYRHVTLSTLAPPALANNGMERSGSLHDRMNPVKKSLPFTGADLIVRKMSRSIARRLLGPDCALSGMGVLGSISESAITTRFLELDYGIFLPYGRNERTDLLIEDPEGQLRRIQCKTGWVESGAVYFDTANHNVTGTKRAWRHYRGQCDYFAVYCSDLKQAYLIPVDDVGKTRAHLRIEPPKNNQEKNIRWAKDYEL